MNFVKCCLALNKIIIIIIIIVIISIISTWSYENRVRKHFVILSQLPLSNSFFTQLFACLLLLLFVVRFVVKDLCRRGFKNNFANFYLPAPPTPPPPLHSFPLLFFVRSYPQFSRQHKFFEISARLKLVSVPFSSLHFVYIDHLEKRFPESMTPV